MDHDSDKRDNANSTRGEEAQKQADFFRQIQRTRQTLGRWEDKLKVYHAPFTDEAGIKAFAGKINLSPRKSGRASIVPADECAVELGAPGKANVNLVMWTGRPSLVEDGRINLVGPNIKPGEEVSWPYAQVVMVELEPESEADPFSLESAQYLSNRLPGYMVRTVPGRLWARISRDAVASGLNFAALGGALIAAYKGDFPEIKAVEVLFVTESDDYVSELEPLAAETRILLGKNKKLVLVGDGEYECSELDCEECDEREVCDEVRDVIILRRKRNKDER